MSDLIGQIAALSREAREVVGAGPERQAEYFDHKAAVFDQIAAADPSQAVEAGAAAERARAEGRRLRRGGGR